LLKASYPLGRIEVFSDRVFAIVVTLPVLELKIPGSARSWKRARTFVDLLPKFLSGLVSFIILWPRSGDSVVRQKQICVICVIRR
jgi:uncharacterized membrane protein